MYPISSCLSCPLLAFIPMCPIEGFQPVWLKSHTSLASPNQTFTTRWIPTGPPEGWHTPFSQVRKHSWRSPAPAQLLPLPVPKADWTWLKKVMPQLILLHCHALPAINHRQQQLKKQPLARRHSHISNYSMTTSVLTSLHEAIQDQLMCLRFS